VLRAKFGTRITTNQEMLWLAIEYYTIIFLVPGDTKKGDPFTSTKSCNSVKNGHGSSMKYGSLVAADCCEFLVFTTMCIFKVVPTSATWAFTFHNQSTTCKGYSIQMWMGKHSSKPTHRSPTIYIHFRNAKPETFLSHLHFVMTTTTFYSFVAPLLHFFPVRFFFQFNYLIMLLRTPFSLKLSAEHPRLTHFNLNFYTFQTPPPSPPAFPPKARLPF